MEQLTDNWKLKKKNYEVAQRVLGEESITKNLWSRT